MIVPIYNVEKYLPDALMSLKNQTYKNFEAILIDDGSTDNSSKIAYEFAKQDIRFKYIRTKNHGQSSARNLGLKKANGKFIAFLDPDDMLQPDFLMILIENFDSNCDIVSLLFPNQQFVKEGTKTELVSKDVFIEGMYLGKIGNVIWNKMFRKEILEGVFFPEGQIHEEIEFFNQFIFDTRGLKIVPRNLYNYRKHRAGNSSSSFTIEELNSVYQLKKTLDYCCEFDYVCSKKILTLYILVFLKDYLNKMLINFKGTKKTYEAVFLFDDVFKKNVNIRLIMEHPKLILILKIWRLNFYRKMGSHV